MAGEVEVPTPAAAQPDPLAALEVEQPFTALSAPLGLRAGAPRQRANRVDLPPISGEVTEIGAAPAPLVEGGQSGGFPSTVAGPPLGRPPVVVRKDAPRSEGTVRVGTGEDTGP